LEGLWAPAYINIYIYIYFFFPLQNSFRNECRCRNYLEKLINVFLSGAPVWILLFIIVHVYMSPSYDYAIREVSLKSILPSFLSLSPSIVIMKHVLLSIKIREYVFNYFNK